MRSNGHHNITSLVSNCTHIPPKCTLYVARMINQIKVFRLTVYSSEICWVNCYGLSPAKRQIVCSIFVLCLVESRSDLDPWGKHQLWGGRDGVDFVLSPPYQPGLFWCQTTCMRQNAGGLLEGGKNLTELDE